MQIKNLNGRVLHEVSGDSLKRACLTWADLSVANLSGADLRWADLSGADLRWANLCRADLREADLRMANLRWANLSMVDLRKAYLRGANLRGANLHLADLRKADLSGATLSEADLRGAVLPLPITPSECEFTGYKKVRQDDGTYAVITLHIPADAQRTSALTSRKCRASRVIVVEGEGVSPTKARRKLRYTPGATVTADRFDSDRREECTHGIHFFMTLEEAQAYQP